MRLFKSHCKNFVNFIVGILRRVQGEDMAGVFHQCGKSIYKRTRDEMDARARIIAHALAEQCCKYSMLCPEKIRVKYLRTNLELNLVNKRNH